MMCCWLSLLVDKPLRQDLPSMAAALKLTDEIGKPDALMERQWKLSAFCPSSKQCPSPIAPRQPATPMALVKVPRVRPLDMFPALALAGFAGSHKPPTPATLVRMQMCL